MKINKNGGIQIYALVKECKDFFCHIDELLEYFLSKKSAEQRLKEYNEKLVLSQQKARELLDCADKNTYEYLIDEAEYTLCLRPGYIREINVNK